MHDAVNDREAHVVPGPCDPEYGCPEPTEIVCIETLKVYDFCFQSERRENVCFNLPHACPEAHSSDDVACEILGVECREVSRTPDPENPGFADVTLLVTVNLRFRILRDGRIISCFDDSFSFMKTILLCAPEGTEIQCESAGSRCGPCAVVNRQICCTVDVCLLVQSKAWVKLLVPSFGFCVPAPCIAIPTPPACPPQDLFPPQCVPVNNQT